jgi:Type II secretion system (T2SS), protein G
MTNAPPRKSAWPLFILAAGAFWPRYGFVIGALAESWALVSSRPHAMLAAGIAAAGALLNLGACFIKMAQYQRSPGYATAAVAATSEDLAKLVPELEGYQAREGHYPSDLPSLLGNPFGNPLHWRAVNIYDHSGSWLSQIIQQRVYEYHLAPGGDSYDLVSAGPDGVAGTPDDIRPALSDSMRAHSNYEPRSGL